jgi:DNA-binding response OmpR family regulator
LTNKNKCDIYIVDDNYEQANILKLLTEHYGYRTSFTTSSESAYKGIIKSKPKLVILDLMMPDVDGLKLCRMIKENPKTSEIKVIIYSGKLYESDRRTAMRSGADIFLTKPTRSQDLLDSIKTLISQN